MRKFVDSAQEPSAAQAKAIFDRGYMGWGVYVAGQGAYHIWADAGIELVLKAGFEVLPIVVPPLGLGGTAAQLVAEGAAACKRLGLSGALAIDTEIEEQDNPLRDAWVNGFENHVRQLGWSPVVYSGAGYSGNAHDWRPDWTANGGTIGHPPVMPGSGDAVQWAGDIDSNGVEVDLSFAGDGFPFAVHS